MTSIANLLFTTAQQPQHCLDLLLQLRGFHSQMAAPNPLPYVPAYLGPGPGLPDACDDRDNHTYPPPDTPCTSIAPGFVNAVRTVGGVPFPQYAQAPCYNIAAHEHNHTVCYHCNRMTENLHWHKLAVTRIKQPPPAPANETNQWRGFLTRMCVLCEQRERYLIAARIWGGFAMIAPRPPTGAQQRQMWDYPRNTCTCQKGLRRGRLCRDHRKDHWDQLRARLVQQRNVNKRWLFETAEYAPPPANVKLGLRTASAARRFNRTSLAPGFGLRGCRCGREVTTAAPVVWQCMACEGIMQVGNSLSPAMVVAAPPNALQQMNSASVGAPLAMRQPRAAATW